jgi:hypothetical protein
MPEKGDHHMKCFKIAALVIAASTCVVAQDALAQVSFGLKAGMGANLDSIEGTDSLPGLGYLVGGSVDVGVGPIGVVADVLFAQRVAKYGADEDNFVSETTKNIYVPVQAKFTLMPLVAVTGGMYYAQGFGNVSAKSVQLGSVLGATTGDFAYDHANIQRSKVGYGLVAGVAGNLPLGVTTLTADLRINYGLKNLSTESGESHKEFGVDLLVGVQF